MILNLRFSENVSKLQTLKMILIKRMVLKVVESCIACSEILLVWNNIMVIFVGYKLAKTGRAMHPVGDRSVKIIGYLHVYNHVFVVVPR